MIWNPRSSRNPSTWSVRTRPPTPSEDSSTTTVRPAAESVVAAASPASPAPTTTTSARWGWSAGLVMVPFYRVAAGPDDGMDRPGALLAPVWLNVSCRVR